jgi:hypothetical protein
MYHLASDMVPATALHRRLLRDCTRRVICGELPETSLSQGFVSTI